MSNDASSDSADLKVIIYSDDRTVREQVRLALGRTLASDLPPLETSEFATQPALWAALEKEDYAVDPIRLPQTVADVVRRARAGSSMPMTTEGFGAPGQSSRHGLDDNHDVPEEMAI